MPHILILEDEPLVAMDLQYAFEDAGAQAHTAVSSEEAMALLDEHEFAGAILDVNLGRGETCESVAIRLNEEDIPYFLHTGDLDRTGEFLRKIDAVVIPKPAASSEVADRLMKRLNGTAA